VPQLFRTIKFYKGDWKFYSTKKSNSEVLMMNLSIITITLFFEPAPPEKIRQNIPPNQILMNNNLVFITFLLYSTSL
jgi:hypothetical protein